MTMPEPFKYKCDGEGCTRTIGDIGAFLWHHIGDEDYCPACAEKLDLTYIYILERDGEEIDATGINLRDDKFAAELFFEEFGHEKQKGDRVVLVDITFEA